MTKKNAEKICKNCRLYKKEEGVCSVNVIVSGEFYELPVLPNDACHWDRINKEMGIEVNQIRSWSDGKNGYVEFDNNLMTG